MKIVTKKLHFDTESHNDIVNITSHIEEALTGSGLKEGQVTVFSIGSTSGITTLEYEPGLVDHDLDQMFDKLAPYDVDYKHNQTWGDDNGASHLRSALTGTSCVLPFLEGKLLLGTWQQVVLINYDTRPRRREVVLQFLGQ